VKNGLNGAGSPPSFFDEKGDNDWKIDVDEVPSPAEEETKATTPADGTVEVDLLSSDFGDDSDADRNYSMVERKNAENTAFASLSPNELNDHQDIIEWGDVECVESSNVKDLLEPQTDEGKSGLFVRDDDGTTGNCDGIHNVSDSMFIYIICLELKKYGRSLMMILPGG
jgi:hypothetical protein